jgi:hypothetical protein
MAPVVRKQLNICPSLLSLRRWKANMEYCHVVLSSPLFLHIYNILKELPEFYEALYGNGAVRGQETFQLCTS